MINEIEKGLEELIGILKSEIPLLKEVRVFGSYENGNWKPKKSDIDIFVLTLNEYYSCFDKLISLRDYSTIESKQREGLRKKINGGLTGQYKNKFAIHIVSRKDLKHLIGNNPGKGDVGRNMLRGRLLYSDPRI